MKLRAASIVTPLLLLILASAYAIDTPRIVPRIQEIPKPVGEVFTTLKKYFTDASSHFELVRADERTRTLVAKQTTTDDLTWRRWAFCETGPVEMIYKLQDGTVTVTVKLEKSPPHSTLGTVSADFQGRYALGGNQTTVACTSILAAAGAAPSK
jgi:hypothetical protein